MGQTTINEHCPYDICVQAALIIFKHHLGDFINVSSDGKGSDWDRARQSCEEHLGYGSDFILSQES